MTTSDTDISAPLVSKIEVDAVGNRTRRRFLVGSAAAFLASGGIALDRRVLARDEGKDDEDDNSGPGSGNDRDDDDDDHHGLPPKQTTQVAGATTVQIVDERFEPNNILIKTGQTVTWVNQDDDQHTASGRGMDTGVIDPGAEGSVTFLVPGEFDYACNFHPEMLGLVTVTGESKATPESTQVSSGGQGAPSEQDVQIIDFAFDPDVATIAVGGTITWTNIGQAPHTVLADWADSDIMNPGVTFSWTFDEAGSYDYQCGLHPAMVGTIEVVPAGSANADEATPESNGAAKPEGVWVSDLTFDDSSLIADQRALVSFQPGGALVLDLVATSETPVITDGQGSWTLEGASIVSEWYMLMVDPDGGEARTVAVRETGEIDAAGEYASSFEAIVTAAVGSTAEISGTVTGHRLSS
jgi:plastocyanin